MVNYKINWNSLKVPEKSVAKMKLKNAIINFESMQVLNWTIVKAWVGQGSEDYKTLGFGKL